MGLEPGSGLFSVLGGVLILVILLYFGRGLPAMLKRSEEAPKDWQGLVFPLLFVVAIVFFVATLLR